MLRCGICGSDLHARHGIDSWADLAQRMGYDRFGRSDQPVVFGHEFCGTVAEHGPKRGARSATGTPVVALPLLRSAAGVETTGLSTHAPGAYAEQMLVAGVADAAGAERPGAGRRRADRADGGRLARGAPRRRRQEDQVAIVIGCGPIGLGVILLPQGQRRAHRRRQRLLPGRRALATACGADIVVDPAQDSPYAAVGRKGHLDRHARCARPRRRRRRPSSQRLPIGWWHAWRLGEKLGAMPKHPVIFECVGVPGVIDSIIDSAPLFSRVVVVGVCVGTDQFTPAMAINKEIDLRFVIGYTPLEFRDALHMLADGKVDPRPLVTGTVGLDGVEGAFDALGDPEAHAKILIDPAGLAKR